MDVNTFIDHFTDCLNHPPTQALVPDTEYKKLADWSSIFSLIVIAMVDDIYGQTLTGEDLRNTKTLAELYHLIQSK